MLSFLFMGAESSSLQTSTNVSFNTVKNSCEFKSDINQTIYAPINLKNCNNILIDIQNEVTSGYVCKSKAMVDVLQSVVSFANVSATAGAWGFAKSDSIQTASNIIQNVLDNSCSSTDQIHQSIDSSITCENSSNDVIKLHNSVTSQTLCQLQTIAKEVQKTDTSAIVAAAAWDPISSFMKGIYGLVAGVMILSVVAVMLKKSMDAKLETKASLPS